MIDITKIVELVFAIIGVIICRYVIPFLKEKKLYNTIRTLVRAAEMLYNESGKGEEKLDYVTKFLESKGYKLDKDAVRNMIEAAVYDMNNEKQITS